MEEGCSKELGLILVTSPILAHPSTQLLQTVVDSFHQVEGLLGCRQSGRKLQGRFSFQQ